MPFLDNAGSLAYPDRAQLTSDSDFFFFPFLKQFFFSLVDEERMIKIPLNEPSSARQRNVSLVGRRWLNIECWLGIFVFFQGIRTSIAKEPYNLWFSRGGGPDPLSPNMDPRMSIYYIWL